MGQVVVVLDRPLAGEANAEELQQSDCDQRDEMERIEPGDPMDPEFALVEAWSLRAISDGEDEPRQDPEHLHRDAAVVVNRPQPVVKRQRRIFTPIANALREEPAIMAHEHDQRGQAAN